MVPGKPVVFVGDTGKVVKESFVGLPGTPVREVAGTQHQVNARPLTQGAIDHSLQRVIGVHAQQGAASIAAEMGISQLHGANHRVDGIDHSFEGTVSFVSPVAEFTPKNVQTPDERAKLVFRIKVRLENPDGIFKPGMPTDAYFG